MGLLVEDQGVEAVARGEAGGGVKAECWSVGFAHRQGKCGVALAGHLAHAEIKEKLAEAATAEVGSDAELRDVGDVFGDA